MIHRSRRPGGVVLATILAIALAACGGSTSSGDGAAPTGGASPSLVVALDVTALLADPGSYDGSTAMVSGFFLTDGVNARLCSAILESYPPQCGEPSIMVLGELPADVVAALERPTDPGAGDVAWGMLEVTGTVAASGPADGPTITISSARIAGG